MKMQNQSVLVITSTYPRWVGDTMPAFVESLCMELNKHNLNAIVIAPHCKKSKTKELLNGVNVHRFRYAPSNAEKLAYGGGMLNNFKAKPFQNSILLGMFCISQLFTAMKLVLRNDNKLIHAHWLLPQGLIAVIIKKLLFWKDISVLVTIHGGDVYGVKNRIYKFLTKYVCLNCDAISVVSSAIAKDFGYENKIFIRSMGVDTKNLFVPDITVERKDILFVGRLVDKKGCDILLNAFSKLEQSDDLVNLNIIGSGPELSKLKGIVKDLKIHNRVKFLGALTHSEIVKWYQSAKIFVMPSIVANSGDQEGLGLVAAEAMSCECLVIASDLPVIRDLIDHKINGVLIPPGDEEVLANAMIKILNDTALAKKLSINARKKIVEKFDWTLVGSDYARILKSL